MCQFRHLSSVPHARLQCDVFRRLHAQTSGYNGLRRVFDTQQAQSHERAVQQDAISTKPSAVHLHRLQLRVQESWEQGGRESGIRPVSAKEHDNRLSICVRLVVDGHSAAAYHAAAVHAAYSSRNNSASLASPERMPR